MRATTLLLCLLLCASAHLNLKGGEAEELNVLLQKLADLEERVERLEERNAREQAPFAGSADADLANIEFPGTDDREAVREYVREVLDTSKGQRTWSTSDPQIEMLKRVGRKNADILFDEMRRGSLRGYHAVHALTDIAGEEHKEQVLRHLRQFPELAALLRRYGWEEEAREDLLARAGHGYLPEAWLHAIAALEGEEAKEALLRHLAASQGGMRSETHELIVELEWISDRERAAAVDEAWERARHGSEWERMEGAAIAVAYGHRNALDALVEMARDGELHSYQRSLVLNALRLHTDGGYSRHDILRWYEENRDNLSFDAEERVFTAK